MAEALLDRYTGAYPRGTVLFREGQPGDRMYVIQSGQVRVVKQVGDEQVTIALLGAGESVGEMAILDGQPRSATAVVSADATLVVLERHTFESLVRESGEIAVRIMRKLSQRLREANRQLEGFLSRNGTLDAVRALEALAGEGADARPLPPGTSPCSLVERAAMSLQDAEKTWERLKSAGILREEAGEAWLAPAPVVEEYRSFLELKQRYDPLTVREFSEMTGLAEDEVHRVVRRVLSSRLQGSGGLVDPYQQFLSMKKRFEYFDQI